MQLLKSMGISASGLSAERLRMDIISSNIANANSTQTVQGGPYRRQVAILAPQKNCGGFKNALQASLQKIPPYSGVKVAAIMDDPAPLKRVYDPEHPHASADGFVDYPNVDVMREMVELITASRAYEANVTALNSTKNMIMKTLEIGRA